jgi:hypothetical protein
VYGVDDVDLPARFSAPRDDAFSLSVFSIAAAPLDN